VIPNRENLRDALIAAAIGGAVAHASKVYAATPTPAPSGFGDDDVGWSGMQTLNQDLSTPLGHALIIGLVLVSGLAWALSLHHPGRHKVFGLAFGGALAIGLDVLLLALFGR
jgi:hypothetical protein